MRNIFILSMLFNLVVANETLSKTEDIISETEEIISKKVNDVMNDIKDGKEPFRLFVQGSIINSDYKAGDRSVVPYKIVNNPLYSATIGAEILPNSLNMKVSYSAQTQADSPTKIFSSTDDREFDRGEEAESKYFLVSLKPLKHLGFFFEDYKYSTYIENDTSNVVYVADRKNDGKNPAFDGGTMPLDEATHNRVTVLSPGEILSTQSNEKKIGVTIHKWNEFLSSKLSKYFVGKLFYVEGNMVFPTGTNTLNSDFKYKGIAGGFGIEKDIDDLSKGWNIKKIFGLAVGGILLPWEQEITETTGELTVDSGGGRTSIELEAAYLFNKDFYVLGGFDFQIYENSSYDFEKDENVEYIDTNIVYKFEVLYRF